MGDTYPQILIYPAIVIERSDKKFLRVGDKNYGKSYLSTNPEFLNIHLSDIKKSADNLLSSIFTELGEEFPIASITEFPGFPPPPMLGEQQGLRAAPAQIKYIYRWSTSPGEFLLVTGDSSHFLQEHSAIVDCLWHDWSNCHSAGFPAGARIAASSTEPRSFFTSGAEHHCAHSTIHNRRAERCHIESFETYFCCKACSFNEVCWQQNTAPMPCGMSADVYREAQVGDTN